MSRQLDAPKFRGGQLFKNHELWLRLQKDNRALGGHENKTSRAFVKAGKVSIEHPSIFNKNKSNFKFPHKMTKNVIFKDQHHCKEFFRSMSEKDRNYRNIREKMAEAQIQSVKAQTNSKTSYQC